MAAAPTTKKRELALVMPVYNEEACIAGVVAAWSGALASLGIDFEMLVLNDGSSDRTGEKLALFGTDDRVVVLDKQNGGHGPTILLGYRLACARADWVFQVDSDGEMRPDHFQELWKRRKDYDALFAERTGAARNAGRKLISLVSRAAVRLLFGGAVADVNVPYRLLRAGILREIAGSIPPDTFAPNVLVSGLLSLKRARVLNLPIPVEGRKTGTPSLVSWRLWKAAARSFFQTVFFRFKGRMEG